MFARFTRTLDISVAPRDKGHHRGCGMQYQLYSPVINKHNDTRQLEKVNTGTSMHQLWTEGEIQEQEYP